MTRADLLEQWGTHLAAGRRRSPHTVRAYVATAARLLDAVEADGWTALARLDSGDLRAQLARRRAEGIGNVSAARELSALKSFLAFAREQAGHPDPAPPRLRCRAPPLGEPHPVYRDRAAPRAPGYPDLPAPPTFLFAAELDSGATDAMLAQLQIPLARLLHGEQSFTYHRPACAGDTVTVRSRIDDIYDKKNGALEFVVKTSRATNQHGDLVAELRCVIVCRNPGGAA